MAKNEKYRPNYLNIYPELADRPDILDVLKSSDRQLVYMERERKHGSFLCNQEEQIAEFIRSTEDSLERLQEEEHRQLVDDFNLEETVILRDEIYRLHMAIRRLEPSERDLIEALYFRGLTERQYAKEISAHKMTIHNRKVKILCKLEKLMKK